MTYMGMASLAMFACSKDIAGTVEDTNTMAGVSSALFPEESSCSNVELSFAYNPTSSAFLPEVSSSSFVEYLSSSSYQGEVSSSSKLVLCKGGNIGPCGGSADLWNPYYYDIRVVTDRHAEDKSVFGRDAGMWFLETDSSEGGQSSIQWDLPLEDASDSLSVVSLIDHCGGVCGSYELGQGSLSYNPFVGVGFYVAGFDSNGVALSADVSNWNGICINYLSDRAVELELDLGDSLNQALGYDLPSAAMTRAEIFKSNCLEWRRFKQKGWGSGEISGEEAAKRLVKVVFRIQGETGTTGRFNIMAIGSY